MDFHGINTVGKIWIERITTKPVFIANYIGRMIFALDTQTLSFGTSAGWIDIISATAGGITNPAIPVGETILFEKDTTVFGYFMEIDQDDQLVYISSGGAGGVKPGSTWTQDPHSHAQNPHTLTIAEMPSHLHPPLPGVSNFMSVTGSSVGDSGDSYGGYASTGYTGGGQPHTHPDSVANNTVAGWRPQGRNFTRQTKI